MVLSESDRLREEDPFTGQAIQDVPSHVIAGRSRFEIDLNRAAETAVYRTPDQCWNLQVWNIPPSDDVIARSLAIHQGFYRMMAALLDEIAAEYGRFILLDIHSYNHRRRGRLEEPTPQAEAPDINIGTFSMPREHWSWLIDPLIEEMRGFNFGGRRLDVRENVAFQGKGEQTRFVHDRYPDSGCAIAIEFKKFFMNEWTGEPDPDELAQMRAFVNHVAASSRALLDGR